MIRDREPSTIYKFSAENFNIDFKYLLEIEVILIRFWYVFSYTDYTILNKLFELYPFMAIVINHVDSFFLTYTQSSEIINFYTNFTLSE